MDELGIQEHWREQARRHEGELAATTRTATIKRLEIAAVSRALEVHGPASANVAHALEVGCGNGVNAFALAERFPAAKIFGVDFAEEMIHAACERLREPASAHLAERLAFVVGDVRKLDSVPGVSRGYDWILSDRCLINLPGWEQQAAVLESLARRLRPGGLLIVIENFQQGHGRQNDARVALDLPRREPAEFNCFLDEEAFRAAFTRHLELLRAEDFASLHDLLLYVLLPSTQEGELDYEHPLVEAATRLELASAGPHPSPFGSFGQNRLYVGRRPEA